MTPFEGDEIDSLLQNALPGMSEIAALFRVEKLVHSGEYDEVVVDGAAMGHSVRLLELPGRFLRLFGVLTAAAERDRLLAERFGGAVLNALNWVEGWQVRLSRLEELFRATRTDLLMISAPEVLSVNEIRRSLADLPAKPAMFVVNRVPKAGTCRRCIGLSRTADRVRDKLHRLVPSATFLEGLDNGSSIAGAAGLRAFAGEVFGSVPRKNSAPGVRVNTILRKVRWPIPNAQHTSTFGKGGVGKTTVSACSGYMRAKADRSRAVLVCSVDPSPSLDDVFSAAVDEVPIPVAGLPNLRAQELNPMQEYVRWSGDLQKKIDQPLRGSHSGVHVEVQLDLQLFSDLLKIVPPGVDEIFAVARVADLATTSECSAVIDMAPAGHALELLRTPERVLRWTKTLMRALGRYKGLALAQDLAVEVATISQRIRSAESVIGPDSERVIVMLAEQLSLLHTRRLVKGLNELGLSASTLIVNRVILNPKQCPRCIAASAGQQIMLQKLRNEFADIYVLPEFGTEIIGAAKIERFGRNILKLG